MKIMSNIPRILEFMVDHVCTSVNAIANAFAMAASPMLVLASVQPEKEAMNVRFGLKCLMMMMMMMFLMQSESVLRL